MSDSISKLLKYLLMTNTALQTKTTKILIIEDEGEMCLVLNLLLNQDEMNLEHVKNLTAATEQIKKEQPDIVILDNKLPDGFGVDFINYLKKNYPSIKIIMISGFDASVRDVALHNGADHFLEKPFTKSQLCQSIDSLLN
jgi:DNA-binding NtrC family response regulator